jgi:hypothetical protein
MSVAIAIAQPRVAGPPGLKARYSRAGTTMPPSAATAGTAIARQSRSSPSFSWRPSSSPTTKKNSVISPSLTQWRRSLASSASPTRTGSLVDHSIS